MIRRSKRCVLLMPWVARRSAPGQAMSNGRRNIRKYVFFSTRRGQGTLMSSRGLRASSADSSRSFQFSMLCGRAKVEVGNSRTSTTLWGGSLDLTRRHKYHQTSTRSLRRLGPRCVPPSRPSLPSSAGGPLFACSLFCLLRCLLVFLRLLAPCCET